MFLDLPQQFGRPKPAIIGFACMILGLMSKLIAFNSKAITSWHRTAWHFEAEVVLPRLLELLPPAILPFVIIQTIVQFQTTPKIWKNTRHLTPKPPLGSQSYSGFNSFLRSSSSDFQPILSTANTSTPSASPFSS